MAARPTLTPPPAQQSPYHGRRMTEAEYLSLPEEKPYLEYVDGVVLQKPMTNAAHGRLVGFIDFAFGLYMRSHGGDYGPERRVYLADGSGYRLPDTSYWAPGRPSGDDSIPTLAVEVRSPDQTMDEQRQKCRAFRRNGVGVCWLIDPESRTVEVFEGGTERHASNQDEILTSPLLPGFELPLKDLFATLDR